MKHLSFIAVLLISGAAFAVEPKEMLKDPALEARAREVSQQLRCVQCQNENIDESDADIAHHMRLLVRERITAGDSNDQIVAYMTSRYGDYVRLQPRFMPRTYLLWFGPALVLLMGAVVAARRLRRDFTTATPLSEEERRELEAVNEHGYPPRGFLHEPPHGQKDSEDQS